MVPTVTIKTASSGDKAADKPAPAEQASPIEPTEEPPSPAAEPPPAKLSGGKSTDCAECYSSVRRQYRVGAFLVYTFIVYALMFIWTYTHRRAHRVDLDPLLPISIEFRDCSLEFEAVPAASPLRLYLRRGGLDGSVFEAEGNAVLAQRGFGSPFSCELTVAVPEGLVLPPLTINAYHAIQTYTKGECHLPFTVGNETFYDCTSTVAVEEPEEGEEEYGDDDGSGGGGDAGNSTASAGAPWCAVEERLPGDASPTSGNMSHLIDYCEPQDQTEYLSITTKAGTGLNLGNHTLTVRGSFINIQLSNVTAGSLDIDVQKGVVTLPHLAVRDDSTLNVEYGDVALAFDDGRTQALTLNFTVGLADYCLASRNATILSMGMTNETADDGWGEAPQSNASAAAAADATNPFDVAYTTTGVVELCTGGAYCDGYPTISTNTPTGALYVTLLAPDVSVGRRGEAIGDTMLTPHFDPLGSYFLDETQSRIEEDPDADWYTLVKLYGPGQQVGKWMYTTSAAMAYVDPWLLASFSGSLFAPATSEVLARAIPSQCPYLTGWTANIPESTAGLGAVSGAMGGLVGFAPRQALVLNTIDTNDAVKTGFTTTPSGGIKRFTLAPMGSMFLVLSIVTSLVLASILAVFLGFNVVLPKVGELNEMYQESLRMRQRFVTLAGMRRSGALDMPSVKDDATAVRKNGGEPEEDGPAEDEDDEDDEKPSLGARVSKLVVANFLPNPWAVPMPQPFEAIEIVVEQKRKKSIDSLGCFFRMYCVRRGEFDPTPKPIPVVDFRELYSAFCYYNGFVEKPLGKGAATLKKWDQKLESFSGPQTDAFCRVRFKTTREIEAEKAAGDDLNSLKPGEDSLRAFIRTRCVITGLEADYIPTKRFNLRYDNFIKASTVDMPVPITTRVLNREYKITYERVTVMMLVPIKGKYNIVTDLDVISEDASEENEALTNADACPMGWYKYDLISVAMHLGFVVAVPVPLVIICVFAELQKNLTINSEWLRKEEVFFAFWKLKNKLWKMTPIHIYLLLGCVGFVCLAIIELYLYYQSLDFRKKYYNKPTNAFKYIGTEYNGWCKAALTWKTVRLLLRWYLQKLVMGLMFLFACAYCGYISLALTWALLGAILNPNKYLAMAAMAATLLAFAGAKAAAAGEMNSTMGEKTEEQIGEHAKAALKKVLKALKALGVGKFAMVLNGTGGASLANQMAAREAVLDVAGAALSQAGFPADLNLPSIANGSPRAAAAVANALRVDQVVASAVIAVLRDDGEALLQVANDLAETGGIEFPIELAQLFLKLSSPEDDVRTATMKKLFIALLKRLVPDERCAAVLDPSALVAILGLSQKNLARFVQQFKLEGVAAFDTLLSSAENDDSAYLLGVKACITKLAEKMGSKSKMPQALVAMTDLVEGRALLTQDWSSAASADVKHFDKLARLLGFPRVYANHAQFEEKWPTRSFLLRFMVAHLHSRKSLLLRMADEIAAYVTGQIMGETGGHVDADSMRALMAIRVGTAINVRAFAAECGIDASFADSLAYIFSGDHHSSGSSKLGMLTGKAALMHVTWLAEKVKSKKDPRRVLGFMSLMCRKTEGVEVEDCISTVLRDFVVLHFGGEERDTPLKDKLRVLLAALRLVTVKKRENFLNAAKELTGRHGERLIGEHMITLGLFARGIDRRVTPAALQVAIDALFADVSEPFGLARARTFLQNLAGGGGGADGAAEAAAALSAGKPEAAGLVTSRLVELLQTGAPGKNETDEGLIAQRDTIANVCNMLACDTEYPDKLFTTILDEALPRKVISAASAASISALMNVAYLKSQTEVQREDTLAAATALYNLDFDMFLSTMHTLLHTENGDNAPAEKVPADQDEDLKEFLETSGLSAREQRGAILFCQKWDVGKAESSAAIESLAKFAAKSGVPTFFCEMLATDAKPSQGNDIMEHLCEFMRDRLGVSAASTLLLEGLAVRDKRVCPKLEAAMSLPGLSDGLTLFGEGPLEPMLPRASLLLSEGLPRDDARANVAAMVALAAHHVEGIPCIVKDASGSFSYKETHATLAEFRASEVVGQALQLPIALMDAFNYATLKKREHLKGAIMDLIGPSAAAGIMPIPGVSTPPGLDIEEVYCRGLLSIASGTVTAIEDLSALSGVDSDLAEGLAQVTGSRSIDGDLCDYKSLVVNDGIIKLCSWLGLGLRPAACLIGLAKHDQRNITQIAADLGLGIKPNILNAIMTVCGCANTNGDFANGFAKLSGAVGPLVRLFGVTDRRAGMVSALVMRVAQGDVSPLKDHAPSLGISRRSIPFICGVVMLASPAPMNFEEGMDGANWQKRRHSHSACRLLSKMLELNERFLWRMTDAGRGLDRGLDVMATMFGDVLKKDVSLAAAHVLILYLVKGYPSYPPGTLNTAAAKEADPLFGTLQEKDLGGFDLLTKLGAQLEMGAHSVHFFLALSHPGFAKRSLKAGCLDVFLAKNKATMPDAVFLQTMRVLVALAHGDEEELREAGAGCEFLQRLGFDVAAPGGVLGEGVLDANSPLIFLMRLAHRQPSAFDIKPAGDLSDDTLPIAETVLHSRLAVPKAILCLCAHDWQSMTQRHNGGTPWLSQLLYNELGLDAAMGSALCALALRGASCRENTFVTAPWQESARATFLGGGDRAVYGVPARKLMNEIGRILKRVGGKGSMYIKGFMAGASEDPVFLTEALSGLCRKLGIEDVNLAVYIVKAMKYDLGSLVKVGQFAMGIGEEPLPDQKRQAACLTALGFVKETHMYSWHAVRPDVVQFEGCLLGRPTPDCQLMLTLCAVARNNQLRMKDVVTKASPAAVSDTQLQSIEYMVSLWNNSSAVFANKIHSASPIDTLDTLMGKSTLAVPTGGVACFFGAVNNMISVVSEKLEEVAPALAGAVKFPAGVPGLLTAIKQDVVLVPTGEGGAPHVAAKFEEPLWQLLCQLSGVAHGDHPHDVARLRACTSFFTNSADNFLQIMIDSYEELDETLMKELQMMIMPNIACFEETVAGMRDRMRGNAHEDTLQWIKGVQANLGIDSPIAEMLVMIGNTTEDIWRAYPLKLLKFETGLTKAQQNYLDVMHCVGKDIEAFLADDAMVTLAVKTTMSESIDEAVRDAALPKIVMFVKGMMSFMASIETQSETVRVAKLEACAEMLAGAFDIEAIYIRGFLSLAVGDLGAGFGDMVSLFCEMDVERVLTFQQVVSKLLPMAALLGEEEVVDEDAAEAPPEEAPGGDEETGRLAKMTYTYQEVFALVDDANDGSGLLIFEEVCELLRLYGLDFPEQRVLWYFSLCDKDATGTIDIDEFLELMGYIDANLGKECMANMGLDMGTLGSQLAFAVLVLLLLFAFIFFGIGAFAVGGGFAAVINSSMPMATGSGGSAGKSTKERLDEMKDKLVEKIESALSDMAS